MGDEGRMRGSIGAGGAEAGSAQWQEQRRRSRSQTKTEYPSAVAPLTHEQREGGDARQGLGLGRADEDKVAVRLEEAEVVVEGHGGVV